MFAPTIISRQVQRTYEVSTSDIQPENFRRRLPTFLSIAIAALLGGSVIQAQAATTDQSYNEMPPTDMATEFAQDKKTPKTSLRNGGYTANQANLFFECQELQASTARLACYDKVAQQGKTPSSTETKQPLDLVETFKTTISGSPQVILAEENATNTTSTTDKEDDQSRANESLSTVGLTEREAEVLESVGVTQNDLEKYSALSLAYDLDQNSERGTWTIRPYQPNYVLPLFYSFDPNLDPTSSNPDEPGQKYTANDVRNTELKFQLSLKSKVAEDLFNTNADLWFGYTQQAHWQVYNEDNSRPFRGTDYQPEIFLTQPVTANLPFGGRLRMLGVGAVHHSNGRSDPISRSWNRAYLMAGAEWGKLSIVPRLWARVNNESDESEDNPDIEDYLGYGDIKFLYDLPKQQSLSGTLRYNPSTNKGAAQIDYVYPLSENVNGYVQLFQGYGESILDYDHENTAIGFGIVLNDWKGF